MASSNRAVSSPLKSIVAGQSILICVELLGNSSFAQAKLLFSIWSFVIVFLLVDDYMYKYVLEH